MSRELDERRAFSSALESYLTAQGWTGLTYTEGWDSNETIKNPQINVYVVDKSPKELEMGRTTNKTFERIFQVDCYMESEQRASAISDDVMDFMDLESITIKDFQNAYKGTMICLNTEGISAATEPPISTNPKLTHWRAIIRGPYLAHYPNG